MYIPPHRFDDRRCPCSTCARVNEAGFAMLEHAIDYLSGFGSRYYLADDPAIPSALDTLYQAHKSIGPTGQIPSWEAQ